jgi:sodium transport system ATP-binding protein
MSTILKVKNITKKFDHFVAVDHLSFSLKEGEVIGLLGPNGAGKTTTIRVIATILAPTEGTAEICGFDIKKDPEKVREHIRVLTTDIGVYERFSGRENLVYFGSLYNLTNKFLNKRIEEIINLLEMEEFIDKKTSKYSTGMRQKLAIARSIIHDPELIIFDEPTSGLDVLASQTVMQFMEKVKELKKSLVLSTHEMSDAEKLCDQVVIMHKGKGIAFDTVQKILKSTQSKHLEEAFMHLIHTSDGKKKII